MSDLGKVGSSTFWNLLQYAGGKTVTFASTVVLARLLLPSDFGLVALALVAINVIDRVKDLGVGQALVQYPGVWSRVSPTGATITVVTAILFAGIGVVAAPAISSVLGGQDSLSNMLRVLSVWILVSGVAVFPESALCRDLAFRERVLPELAGAVVKAVVAVSLALSGWGAWSLVWGQVVASTVITAGYWLAYRSRGGSLMPFGWSREVAGRLVRFGSSLSWVALFSLILDNIDYLVIGRRLGAEQLGFYTIAFRLPELIVIGACTMIGQVLFSSFSRIQHSPLDIRAQFLRATTVVASIAVPAALGLAAAAPQIVLVVFGPGFAPAIPILVLLGIYSAIYALSFSTGDVYKAIGRADILIQLSLAKLAVFVPVLWWAAGISPVAVAAGLVGVHLIFGVVRLYLVHRVLRLSVAEQWRSIWPSVVAGSIMALLVVVIPIALGGGVPLPGVLLVQVVVGAMAYFGALCLLDDKTFRALLSLPGKLVGR